MMNLSIIIPAYNEARKIKKTLDEIISYIEARDNFEYEILIVNDGSTDNTLEILENYSKNNRNIQIISYTENRGKGYAVKTGAQSAHGEHILFMDADHSVNIDNLDVFLESQKKHDVSIGSIYIQPTSIQDNNGILRKLLRKFFYRIPKLVLGINVHDTQRGFKMFSKHAASIIFPKQTIDGFGFDIEILYIAKKHKLSINEIPIQWSNPPGEHVNIFTYFEVALDLIKILKNSILKKYRK